MFPYLIAAGVAGVVTFLEMDRVFKIPRGSPVRWRIRGAMGGFVAVNSILAVALYALVIEAGFLESTNDNLGAFLVGTSYLGLVRLKFATVEGQPFGFEYFYELAKDSAYDRINHRVIGAKEQANMKLAEGMSLADLVVKATSHSTLDSLASEEEKLEAKAWILRVIEDTQTYELQKKLVLADFINFGSRDGHS